MLLLAGHRLIFYECLKIDGQGHSIWLGPENASANQPLAQRDKFPIEQQEAKKNETLIAYN